jgi:hypothetical protein
LWLLKNAALTTRISLFNNSSRSVPRAILQRARRVSPHVWSRLAEQFAVEHGAGSRGPYSVATQFFLNAAAATQTLLRHRSNPTIPECTLIIGLGKNATDTGLRSANEPLAILHRHVQLRLTGISVSIWHGPPVAPTFSQSRRPRRPSARCVGREVLRRGCGKKTSCRAKISRNDKETLQLYHHTVPSRMASRLGEKAPTCNKTEP